jgi:hypothetical protein
VLPARFQNGELSPAVDVQICIRILHRVDVACLAGKIEENVLSLDEVAHAVPVSDIRDVYAYLVLDAVNIVKAAPILRYQTVNQCDLRSKSHEPSSKVGADEAEAASYQDLLVPELFIVHRRRGLQREKRIRVPMPLAPNKGAMPWKVLEYFYLKEV